MTALYCVSLVAVGFLAVGLILVTAWLDIRGGHHER